MKKLIEAASHALIAYAVVACFGCSDGGTADSAAGIPDSGLAADSGLPDGEETDTVNDVPDGGEAETATEPDGGPPEPVYETATVDLATSYTNSEGAAREVKVRLWYPVGFSGAAPVILVSHGGDGSTNGHTTFVHLGEEFAAHGYLSLHLNHNASTTGLQHRLDRPADVSAVLDALEDGDVSQLPGFGGTVNLARIGHTGHSWGAYTSHAVAGAEFEQGNFRDDRIKAFAPMSPQGWGGFGAFDDEHEIGVPSANNSWMNVALPAFSIVGGAEKDEQGGAFVCTDWRLFPFARYPEQGDKYLAVIPGQDHDDIGGAAEPAVRTYMARNLRLFFDVYLKGEEDKVCLIGKDAWFDGTELRRKFLAGGLPDGCP